MKLSKLVFGLAALTISIQAIAQEATATHYGSNILSISPVQLTNVTPTGAGLNYEHMLSRNMSLYVPIAYAFGKIGPCDPSAKASMFYSYPGIKFYPSGSDHKVTYAVGPSLALGTGTIARNAAAIDPGFRTDAVSKVKDTQTELGAIINNSLNINATRHFYIGVEAGMGVQLMNIVNGHNTGTDMTLQGNIKFGYRF